MDVCTYVYAYIPDVYAYIPAYMCGVCVCMCVYEYVCACVSLCTRTHTRLHTHTRDREGARESKKDSRGWLLAGAARGAARGGGDTRGAEADREGDIGTVMHVEEDACRRGCRCVRPLTPRLLFRTDGPRCTGPPVVATARRWRCCWRPAPMSRRPTR